MKTLILLTFMMLFASVGILSAQPNPPDYYTGKTRIIGDGYIYNIELNDYNLKISNELNTIINTKPPQTEYWFKHVTNNVERNETETFFKSIALNEIKALAKEVVDERANPQKKYNYIRSPQVIIAVNSESGKIMELYFSFSNTHAAKAINPDKLYKLEQFIKQNITITGNSFDFSSFIVPEKTPADIEKIETEMKKHQWIKTKIPLEFTDIHPIVH